MLARPLTDKRAELKEIIEELLDGLRKATSLEEVNITAGILHQQMMNLED